MFILPQQLPLFEGIQALDFGGRVDQLPLRKFPKGMAIFEKGESSNEVFGILSGTVEIVGQDQEQNYIRVATLKPGDIFGEFSYFTGAPRSNASIALEDVAAIEMSATWLDHMKKHYVLIRKRLWDLYQKRVLANVLKKVHFFSLLPQRDLELLANHLTLRQAEDGEKLIQQGSKSNDLMIIKRGKIKIRATQKGKDVELAELKHGDIFGEMAVVTGEPRAASAYAIGPTEIMVLSGEKLQTILRKFPKVLKNLEDLVRARFRETQKAFDSVLSTIVDERWGAMEGEEGIQVEPLGIKITYETGSGLGLGKLISISKHAWVLKRRTDSPLKVGSKIEITFSSENRLALPVQAPFVGKVQTQTDSYVRAQMLVSPEVAPLLTQLIATLTRARLEALVCPEDEKIISFSEKPSLKTNLNITLTKTFPSLKHFIKVYLSTIEQGWIEIEGKGEHIPGTPVQIRISILERETWKFVCTGKVKNWKKGKYRVELDELSILQNRVRQFLKNLMEEFTEKTWKERKEALLPSESVQATDSISSQIKVRAIVVALGLLVILLLFWLFN